MVVCPACGSSRIRHDYRPAPFYLRIFLIRGLLCDHCNRQFRAFSLRMPSSRPPSHLKKRADTFIAPPVGGKPAGGAGTVTAGPHLREEIGRRQASAVKLEVTPESTVRNDSEAPPAAPAAGGINCPECGSDRVKRRPRKTIERAIFTFTNHKAFVCRECQASFYHRPEA
jgi:hypothetical protein